MIECAERMGVATFVGSGTRVPVVVQYRHSSQHIAGGTAGTSARSIQLYVCGISIRL